MCVFFLFVGLCSAAEGAFWALDPTRNQGTCPREIQRGWFKNSCLKLFHKSLLRETRGARNPNLQVTITHAWNVVASFRFNFRSDFQQE